MTHFEKAIDYVRQKHSWNEYDEALALEDMVRYRCPIEFTDDDNPALERSIKTFLAQELGFSMKIWEKRQPGGLLAGTLARGKPE